MSICESSLILTLKAILNTLLHQLLAVITVYAIWSPILIGGKLSWHVILCSFGVFLIAESLILIGSDNVYTIQYDIKETRINIHSICSFLGVICIISGIALEIIRKNEIGRSHFSTAHGDIGLISLIIIFFSLIFGFITRFGGLFKGFLKEVVQKLIHNLIGIITYFFLFASLCTGFYSSDLNSDDTTNLAATIVSCIVCLWSLKHSFKSLYGQIRVIN